MATARLEAPSQVTYLSGGFRIHLAADLTEDGMLDLVGGSSVYLGPGVRSDSLVVFPSLGSRAFGTAIRTVTEGYTHALSVADLDHDGHLDIVVYDRVHAGDGTGAFDPVPSMLPARGEAVATPDLDLDGWNDIVFQDGAAVRVVRNREGQGFDEAGRYLIGFTAHNRPGLVVADLDVDGLQDVVAFPHMFVSGDNLSGILRTGGPIRSAGVPTRGDARVPAVRRQPVPTRSRAISRWRSRSRIARRARLRCSTSRADSLPSRT